MDWTGIVADRKIKEAIDDGEFDNLPGKGKPLDLESEMMLSPEQRIANRILKNANALPEWLQIEKDIEREAKEILPAKERALRALRLAKNEASRQRIADRLRYDHRERVDMVNTMIIKYNFIAPTAAQRVFKPYVLRREMAELDTAICDVSENL